MTVVSKLWQLKFIDGNFYSYDYVPVTPTPTRTSTVTITPTFTPTKTITPSVGASVTPTTTPTRTPTNTATPTITPSPSVAASNSITPTSTPITSPTSTFTPTPTLTRTASATPSATRTISITPSITRTPTVTPSTGASPSDNDGFVISNYTRTAWDAAIDAHTIISLDVNSTVPNWGTNGGSSITYTNESWWNGPSVPVATMRPPTTAQLGSGIGSIEFWKRATKVVRQINIRWETYFSDSFCSLTNSLPKWLIVRSYRNLNEINTGGTERPIFYLAPMQEADNTSLWIPGALCLAPAQGTYRMFSGTNIIPAPTEAQFNEATGPARGALMRQPFYWRATPGVDGAGNPIIAASEIVCVEIRANVMQTTDEPNGVIGFRVTRRNGQVFERCCAWNWDFNCPPGLNYIADIDNWGGGYYNGANNGNVNLWTKMGRRMTFGINYQPSVGRAWIGPPTGFSTG